MKSTGLILITVFCSGLGSPFPEPEAATARNLVGYIDGSGNFIGNRQGGQSHEVHNADQRHASHHIDIQEVATLPYKLNEVNTKALATDIFDQNPNNVTIDGATGRKCIKKVMMTEYTDYTDVTTCVHKSKKRCHTTYVTDFKGHQEQKCDEKFEKRCSIYYENVAQNDEVEVCKTSLCQDCTKPGPAECETVYDTVCETTRKVHDVEDDVVNCETVEEEKCEDVPDGEN